MFTNLFHKESITDIDKKNEMYELARRFKITCEYCKYHDTCQGVEIEEDNLAITNNGYCFAFERMVKSK